MPLYTYRCVEKHEIESYLPAPGTPTVACHCGLIAHRRYNVPMTGVMGYRRKLGRRRRANPGDDMYTPHDRDAARIARSV